jgi:hypothetical protein
MCDIFKGSIYFKGNEKFTINELHGVLALYRSCNCIGVFWIMDHYTLLHFEKVLLARPEKKGFRSFPLKGLTFRP